MEQPNLLIVMADQLTAPALPCYGPSVVKAPHLDRLAAEGVLFENAYCNSPLLRAVARLDDERPAALAHRRLRQRRRVRRRASPTLAHGLRAQGYRTCLCGKMHFVGPDQLHGFEERLTPDIYPADFGWTPNWDQPEERIDWWYHNMLSVKQAGIAETTNQLDFDDEVAFHAVRFLKDYRRAATRARSSWWSPSPTRTTPMRSAKPTGTATTTSRSHRRRSARCRPSASTRTAAACARCPRWTTPSSPRTTSAAPAAPTTPRSPIVDDRVGELLRRCASFGLAEDTVIALHLRPRRHLGRAGPVVQDDFFEWAVRVPLIVHAPTRFAPRRGATLASLLDLMPTLLELGQAAGRRRWRSTAEPGAAAGRRRPRRIAPCSANISPRARSRRSS